MARQSELLERQAEEARLELAGALDELRSRLTPGGIVDELTEYARHGPPAEFVRNLARDIRENPMPLLLVAMGVLWAIAWRNRHPVSTDFVEPATRDFARTSVTDAVASAPGRQRPTLVRAEG